MQKNADSFISNNERAFILKALQEELRLDGRQLYDFRKIKFQFSLDDRSATVQLGQTRVMSVITASLEAPFPDRPNEGPIRFNVEFSPMASPAFEPGRPGEEAIEVARLIERGLRQSNAIDQEALCVMAGRKVWSLRVDSHVLDHGGNLLDGCFMSALAALMVFRKPEVSVGGPSGTEVVVHPPEVKEPLPLTIHHLPVSVTFALFEDGATVVVDPSLAEEAAMQGSLTVSVNTSKEVCCVHKADGVGITTPQLLRCIRLASSKAEEVVAALKKALEAHEVARVQARVRRHAGVVGLPEQSRTVLVKQSADLLAATQQELAQELGIKLPAAEDDVDMASGSSSSSEEEEEEEQEEQDTKAAAGPANASGDVAMTDAAPGPGSASSASARSAKVKKEAPAGSSSGARLSGGLGLASVAVSKQSDSPAKSGGKQASKTKPVTKVKKEDVKYDELEAIAAVIAGAGVGTGKQQQQDVADLGDAVKPKYKHRLEKKK